MEKIITAEEVLISISDKPEWTDCKKIEEQARVAGFDVKYIGGNRFQVNQQIKVPSRDKSWMKFRIGFGEHRGKTLKKLCKSHYGFILFLSKQNVQGTDSDQWKETLGQVRKCVQYVNSKELV